MVPGGGGGVGHQALQYGKAMGIRILAIDTGDDKKQMCLEMGAESFVDFKTSKDVAAEVNLVPASGPERASDPSTRSAQVREVTGGGAHAVIVTGGTAGAYSSAPGFLRKGGTMVSRHWRTELGQD